MTGVISSSPTSSTFLSETRIEYVMLCDSAQTGQDGKLHVLGGGWSAIARPVLPAGVELTPPPNQFSIAASFLVDWNEANRPIAVRVTIEPQDEGSPLFEVQAQLTTGRPPQATAGDPLRIVIAIPILMHFPSPGAYAVRAHMEGAPQDIAVRFHVVNAVMVAPPANQ